MNEAERLEQAENQILELLGKRVAAGTAKSGDIIAWTNVRISRSLRSIDQRLENLAGGVYGYANEPIAQVLRGIFDIETNRDNDKWMSLSKAEQAKVIAFWRRHEGGK